MLFSKKKSIRGLFVGKSGCGFTHGHIYDIDIRAYRKRAEERVKAVETAQTRIDALIARAGGPMMVVRNTQESDEEKHNGARAAIERMADEQFHGNVVDYIGNLVDTIDRLEAALYNTLNERDQLLDDLGEMVNRYSVCDFCKYDDGNDLPHGICEYCMKESDQWKWRGVPDKEE